MKPTLFIAGLSAFALGSTAYAADVTVTVTGATAFRAATLKAIKSRFSDSGQPFKYAHDQVAGNLDVTAPNATRAIFIGTFPGVTGTTTIKCCFTGSVEGIRALVVGNISNGSPIVDPLPPTYYPSTVLDSTTAVATSGGELAFAGSGGSPVSLGASVKSDIAFSDVSKAATPYASQPLQPASPAAGVIAFTMLTNEGSTVSNVTALQFRALLTNGYQPLSLFTGNPLDTTNVYATGRNDGSGTRASYLSEVGYGVSNTVQQYVANVSSGNVTSTIQLVPQGGVGVPPQGLPGQSTANASTVWLQDVAGNGGYQSGSSLRDVMGRTAASVTVLDALGNTTASGVRADLVTWLSVNDAATARGAGAVFCAYNGEKLTDIATAGSALGTNDIAKITNGKYTAWNYENMYRNNAIGTGVSDKKTVYDGIKAEIPTNLAAAGIAISSMAVGRPSDGGVVAP